MFGMRVTTPVMSLVIPFLICACDLVDTLDTGSGCYAQFVAAHPAAPLAVPGLPVWAAMRTSPTCTKADVAGIKVRLYSEAAAGTRYHGVAALKTFTPSKAAKPGCAVFIWSGAGADTEFTFTADAADAADAVDDGDQAIVTSAVIKGFKAGAVLPMWQIDGEWSQYLFSPAIIPDCAPVNPNL